MGNEDEDLQAQADALASRRNEACDALVATVRRYTDTLQAFWNTCFTWRDVEMVRLASIDPQLKGFDKEVQRHLAARNERLKQVQVDLEEAVYAIRQVTLRSYHLAQKVKDRRADHGEQ